MNGFNSICLQYRSTDKPKQVLHDFDLFGAIASYALCSMNGVAESQAIYRAYADPDASLGTATASINIRSVKTYF